MCCPTFTSDHPESHYREPFKPKLLTWTLESLDVEFDRMDFISADVNDERAPKGLTCPTITAVPDDGPSVGSCPLCDSPRTLKIIQGKQADRQGISADSAETLMGEPAENSMNETTATDGPAGRRENGQEVDQVPSRNSGSGGGPSSIGISLRSDSPHYLDP